MPLLLQRLYDDVVKLKFKAAVRLHRLQNRNSHLVLRTRSSRRSHCKQSPMSSQ